MAGPAWPAGRSLPTASLLLGLGESPAADSGKQAFVA